MIPEFQKQSIDDDSDVGVFATERDAREYAKVLKYETRRGSGYRVSVAKRHFKARGITIYLWVVIRTKPRKP